MKIIEQIVNWCRIITCIFSVGTFVFEHQALAQQPSNLWTTGSPAACPANSYQWTLTDTLSRFEDARGKVDAETLTSKGRDGFETQTVQSQSVPTGTKWGYTFAGQDRVEVRNLSNGRGFTLSRCPDPATPISTSSDASWAGTYRYGAQGHTGDMSIVSMQNGMKIQIKTGSKVGGTCDVSAIENAAARKTIGNSIFTQFTTPEAVIKAQITPGKIELSYDSGDFDRYCGIRTYFIGPWTKVGGGVQNQNPSQSQKVNLSTWNYMAPEGGESAKLAYGEPDSDVVSLFMRCNKGNRGINVFVQSSGAAPNSRTTINAEVDGELISFAAVGRRGSMSGFSADLPLDNKLFSMLQAGRKVLAFSNTDGKVRQVIPLTGSRDRISIGIFIMLCTAEQL